MSRSSLWPDVASGWHAGGMLYARAWNGVQAVAAVLRVHPGVLRQAGQLAQEQEHLAGGVAGAITGFVAGQAFPGQAFPGWGSRRLEHRHTAWFPGQAFAGQDRHCQDRHCVSLICALSPWCTVAVPRMPAATDAAAPPTPVGYGTIDCGVYTHFASFYSIWRSRLLPGSQSLRSGTRTSFVRAEHPIHVLLSG